MRIESVIKKLVDESGIPEDFFYDEWKDNKCFDDEIIIEIMENEVKNCYDLLADNDGLI